MAGSSRAGGSSPARRVRALRLGGCAWAGSAVLLAAAAAAAAPAAHAYADVQFGGSAGSYRPNTYRPASVRIPPLQQVTWTGAFAGHPLRSARASEPYANSTGTTFSHTFAAAGLYRYYCAVHGSSSADNTVGGMSGEVVVTSNQPPAAKLSASPSSVQSGGTVSFDGSASSDAEGPVTHAWDLDGDGEFDDATGPTASHVYTTPANAPPGSSSLHRVSLRVTDGNADGVGPESGVASVDVTAVAPTGGPTGTPTGGPTGTGPQPDGTDRRPPAGRLLGRRLTLRAKRIRVRVESDETADAAAVLRHRGRTLARGSVRVRPAGVIRLRLTSAGRTVLRRQHRLRASLRLTFTDLAHNRSIFSRTVTVRRG